MGLSTAQKLADFLDLEVGTPDSPWYKRRLQQAIENHVYAFADDNVEFKPVALDRPRNRLSGIMFITQHVEIAKDAPSTSTALVQKSDDTSNDHKVKLWLLERGVPQDSLEWVTTTTNMLQSGYRTRYNDLEDVESEPGGILEEAEAELQEMEEQYGESLSALDR